MVNRRGFSLVEILIATALGGILLYGAFTIYIKQTKQLNQGIAASATKSNLAVISGQLQKYLASGDLRFLAFVGSPTDRPLARMLVPQVEKCADLSTCANTSAFLYVDYNKLTTPTVTAICNYDESGQPFDFLVDLQNPTYGLATALSDGFDVTPSPTLPYVAGKVKIVAGSLLALMNPPFATLYVAQRTPVRLNLNQHPTTGMITPPLDDRCKNNLRVISAGPPVMYDLSSLYKVQYRPLVLTQFTGGSAANVSDDLVKNSQGTFPLRLFSGNLRSLGRWTGSARVNDINFAMIPCSLSTGGTVSCTNDPMALVPDVEQVHIEEVYSVKVGNSPADSFQLIPTGGTLTPGCDLPRCTGLTIANNATMKVLYTPTESIQDLDPTGFSFLKQDMISRLRFRLRIGVKDDIFDIVFP